MAGTVPQYVCTCGAEHRLEDGSIPESRGLDQAGAECAALTLVSRALPAAAAAAAAQSATAGRAATPRHGLEVPCHELTGTLSLYLHFLF